jgi:hypothetical protein
MVLTSLLKEPLINNIIFRGYPWILLSRKSSINVPDGLVLYIRVLLQMREGFLGFLTSKTGAR